VPTVVQALPVKHFSESLQRLSPAQSSFSVATANCPWGERDGASHEEDHHHCNRRSLGFFNAPTFAKSYVINGHAASPAEVQFLVSNGVPPGTWVVNGFGIAPADGASASTKPTAAKSSGKTCWYVLDELLCD
jgi:hypothetical protein